MSSFVLWNQAEDIFLLIVSMFPGFGRVRIYLLKDIYLEIIWEGRPFSGFSFDIEAIK